jgi:methyl-accepting chemotaxis protein
MHILVIVFLAVIAVSSLLQAAAAVAAAIAARKLEERVDELEGRFERDLRPALANVARIVETAADVSDKAAAQARRVDSAVAGAAERINDAVDRLARGVQETVVGSLEKVEDRVGRRVRRVSRPFARAAAIVEGFRRGVIVWRQGPARRPPAAAEPPNVA